MEHLMIFFFFITISIGLSSLFLFLVSYRRFKSKSIKYILIFFCIITFRLAFNTFFLYLEINFILQNRLELILFYIAKEIPFLMILIIPFIYHIILPIPFVHRANSIILSMIILIILIQSSAFIRFTVRSTLIYVEPNMDFINILYLLIMLYPFILLLFYYKRIQIPELKNTAKIISISLFLFIIFDTYSSWTIFYVPNQNIYLSKTYINWLQLIFYFFWNLFFMIYAIRPFLLSPALHLIMVAEIEINESYGLTPQEKNIARSLAKGYDNKKIADENFISINTVKKHIRNIYQKLSVKNRVELLNIVKK